MASVLHKALGVYAAVFLDDVVVYSKTFDELLRHVDAILQMFEKAGLQISPSKCEWFASEVHYLGQVLSKGGRRSDERKVEAVKNMRAPTNKSELLSALGGMGYHRQYIKDYAKIAAPLQELATSVQHWCVTTRTDTHQQAYDTLKEKLCTAPVLAWPDFAKPFIGVGGVLAQEQEGKVHPVAYASRRLSESERRLLFPLEFEALAVIYCLDAFRWAVFGHRVTVVTDHFALKWLFTLKVPSSKLLRWAMRVLEYDAVIQHRAGKQHGNADMLSRLGVIGEEEPALTSCEDALRDPPEERGSISLALHGDGNSNYTKRFTVVQGYVIDLAAGLPAKMGISLAVEVKTDDEQPIVDNTMDISIRGPVHSGDGVNEEQSRLIRAAYEQLKSNIISDFSDDATAQVCSTTLNTNTISNLQNKYMEVMIWHAYEHTGTVAQENDTEAVTTPKVYSLCPTSNVIVFSALRNSIITISKAHETYM
jgi:hypothetical protein